MLCDLLVQVASYHTSLMPHLHENLNMFKSSLVLNVVLNCSLYKSCLLMFLNFKFGRKGAQVNIFLNSVCWGGGEWGGE